MAGVVLDSISKSFGDVDAVRELTLEIGDGEFFSLLGPSGCGKTTTLRLVAGFEEPTSGRVFLGDRDVTQVPAHKRPVNTVFQSYALFPHLNVAENVAFGLRFRNVDKRDRGPKVAKALELVRLEGLQRRRPSQLSGGQQQRVALARALVLEPAVLLLDEPLGALDARLRRSLQIELKAIQEQVGITFVYVTHDQEEALTMSDRMAVMSDGRVQQLGTPQDVYEEPETSFVADFLGVSNLMEAVAEGDGRIRLGGAVLVAERGDRTARGDVKLTIRPERIRLEPPGSETVNSLPGTVRRIVYLGSVTQVFVELPGDKTLQATVQAGDSSPPRDGDAVSVVLPPEALRVLGTEAPAASD
jgi:spermidine/putrescine transport system ATP-binding protein